MAITSSTVRIYTDSDKSSLVDTIITAGATNPILAENLDEGQEYWATIAVAEDQGRDSDESPVYQFFTLPNVVFTTRPSAAGTTIQYSTAPITHTVGIARYGIRYTTDPNQIRSRENYSWEPSGFLTNLLPKMTYYLTPVVEDVFGRRWANETERVGVATGAEAPSIMLSHVLADQTMAEGDIIITSNSPITAVSVRLQAQGSQTYINATGYTTITGVQHWTVSGLSPNTTYTVYASCANSSGVATDTTTITTNNITASVTLDDYSLSVSDPYSSIYVEAVGTGTGIEADTVGVKFYLTDSHAGTPIADTYGQQGQTSIASTQSGLPNGEYIYGFAYMDYLIGTELDTVWSASQSLLTAPTVDFGNIYAVGATTLDGSIVPHGSVISTKTVEYKPTSGSSWTTATLNANNGFYISGLTPNTQYDLRATVSNASGSMTINTTFTTNVVVPTVTAVSADDITKTSALVTIAINY